MEKLPEDFKKKWIAALRSGEYKQGREVLHNERDNTFCCIGVACHLILGLVPKGYYFIPKASEESGAFGDVSLVPVIIRGGDAIAGELSQMNDGAGEWHSKPLSFLEIADWIEKNL